LTAIPGVGPVTATALIAAIANGSEFEKDETWRPGSGWFRVGAPAARSYVPLMRFVAGTEFATPSVAIEFCVSENGELKLC
jgi:hypothetical protein